MTDKEKNNEIKDKKCELHIEPKKERKKYFPKGIRINKDEGETVILLIRVSIYNILSWPNIKLYEFNTKKFKNISINF